MKVREYNRKGMQKSIGLILLFVCIATIMIAGCTSQPAPVAVTTTAATAMPTTTAPVQTMAPVQTAAPIAVVTTQAALITTVATTTAPADDPIIHRWIRKIIMTNPLKAYELKFYPGGIVVFNKGNFTEVSSNMMIKTPYDIEASGNWVNLGNNKYLVRVVPTNIANTSPYVWEYTYVGAHTDSAYPGIVFNAHIEDQEERDAVPKSRLKLPDEMYYPELAKID